MPLLPSPPTPLPTQNRNVMAELYPVMPELFNYIIRYIMAFLPVPDLYHFTQTCRGVGDVGISKNLWKIIFHRDYCLTRVEDSHMDYYELYKQLYSTIYHDGVAVRLACSRDAIGLGMRTVFTTTIYNTNDHPVRANQRDSLSHLYESAAHFVSAWKHDDSNVTLQRALPSTAHTSRGMIGMRETQSLEAAKVLPPHSQTEFSVVGRLDDMPECRSANEVTDTNGVYLSFPSHHLKVAEKFTHEFWVRTRVQIDNKEILSNVVKLNIVKPIENKKPITSGAA